MAPTSHCPKCEADVSDSYEGADPSVGIFAAGWYCDTCDLFIEHAYEPMEDDVPIISATEALGDRPRGTPISQLSGRPGEPGYAEFKRIAKSWGYD